MSRPQRNTARFDLDTVSEPTKLHRALNEYALSVQQQVDALAAFAPVAVLDDIYVQMLSVSMPNESPFPLQVQVPFPIRGAIIIQCECVGGATAEAGVATDAVVPWVRAVSGGVAGQGSAMEILYISGLTAARKYRFRFAVFGVQQ